VAARFPLQAPLAVQLVPVFEVHVTAADWPSVMVVGFTTTLTVALGIMGLEPEPYPPPPPPQLARIRPQRIPVTLLSAARCVYTLVPLKAKRCVESWGKCQSLRERFNLCSVHFGGMTCSMTIADSQRLVRIE
jgi:hypothetical protein